MDEITRPPAVSGAVLLQDLIDALPDGVAIIDAGGTVQVVNEVWRAFSRDNGGDTITFHVGTNYLQICRDAVGDGCDLARKIAAGLSHVLEGGERFSEEYPCHCAAERRWFLLEASPLNIDGERHAIILHRNVSEQKQRQIEATNAQVNASNLAAIVDAMPDAVIGLDLQGRITKWNAAARDLYGYEAQETIGQSIKILFPEDWDTPVDTYVSDLISRKHSRFEVVRQTRSGQRRRIEITAAPITSPSGQIIGVSNVNRDVTEMRRAEQRMRDVLDNLFVFVGVLSPDGVLLDANAAPLEAAGLTPPDVIGKAFWDCYWWNYTPDVQDRLREACIRAASGELVRYDEQVRVAGGRIIWLDFQLAPLFNEDGEVENLIPSGIDITERKAALNALRTSHDTFSNLVKRSPFGIYTVDADFRLAHVSDGAQKAFVNVHPLIGRDFAEVFNLLWPERFASEVIARFRQCLETGEPYGTPSSVERRSDTGEVESYDWKIERIMMPDGRPGVVCNFYDLSERLRHEEHIRYLMREVNHRSKNLLTVVTSMARQTAFDGTPRDFIDRFSDRLLGLAASHDLIVQGNWGGVTLRELIKSQLSHLTDDVQRSQVCLDGPEFVLSPEAAQGIGMALHELSTNAIKYGALSVAEGAVAITWGVNKAGGEFFIRWREHGGPKVAPPERTGFGQTVIEKMAAISVGGSVDLDYPASGVTWHLTAPVDKIVVTAHRPQS